MAAHLLKGSLLLLALCVITLAKITPTTEPNMNGDYLLQNTPKQSSSNWSTQFKDYPGGVESFEVYAGPINTTYGEVFWTALPEIELPPELVERFAGKGMAVVGFEADQVRRTPEGDVSVPINIAYNHHYGATLLGKGSAMQKVARDPTDPRTLHPGPEPGYVNMAVEHTPSASGLPTSMVFGYSNGGEFRKTYHGLLPPYAQIVESPDRIHVEPMQIDTWNRDKMNLTGGAFVPGPAPKNSLAPTSGVDAIYSGLLECPLTTRIRKHITGGGWNDTITPQIFDCDTAQRCTHTDTVDSAPGCFAAAGQLPGLAGLNLTTTHGSSSSLPPGCTVAVAADNLSADIFFNSNNASTACCGTGVEYVSGAAQDSIVSMGLNLSASEALITLTGPNGVWFGVGFDADSMSNAPYALIVDGSGQVSERVLGDHMAGVELAPSIKVVSSTVSSGQRTVTVSRALEGASPQHYSFQMSKLSMSFINAVGSSAVFGYHRSKTVSLIQLWPSQTRACVCAIPAAPFGQGTGTLEYLPSGETIGFPLRCNPTETVLANKNPTCDIRTYSGGLSTCHHGWHMLDADQAVPWPDQPLVYYLKYRLYFQEYDPAEHVGATDITWSIAGDTGEYDVPQCPHGTPVEQCVHEISGMITPGGTDLHFVAAHYHCHAPTCLSLEIWNNQTGELLCKESPYHGQGNDITGDDRFDEQGYIAQRVCLWGGPPFEPPPLVSGVPLFVKAITNSTYGHHGEMALPQMLLASIPAK